MKKTIRIICSVFSLIFASTAFSMDYGFLIDNDTAFRTNAAKKMYLGQKDSVTGWVKVPFKDPNNYFITEGIYKFEFNADSKKVTNYVDLNLLKIALYKKLPGMTLESGLGRFFAVDLSGLIFSQNADGVSFKLSNKVLETSLYLGYTGLLNGNMVSMIDAVDFKQPDSHKVYDFCDRNLVAMASVSFPELFAKQNLSLQGIGAFRLDDKQFNRMYATLGIDGPLVGNLFYTLSGTAGFSSYKNEDMKISELIKASLVYYFAPEKIAGASIGVNAVYAGKNFTGVTSQSALNSLKEPEYSDLIKAGLSGTVKPIDNLLISLSGDVAFDGKKNFELKGIQYKAGVDYQIVSDVFAGVDWVQYFDINKSDVDFQKISLKVKLAL